MTDPWIKKFVGRATTRGPFVHLVADDRDRLRQEVRDLTYTRDRLRERNTRLEVALRTFFAEFDMIGGEHSPSFAIESMMRDALNGDDE